MMTTTATYDRLAVLYAYPTAEFRSTLAEAAVEAENRSPEAARSLQTLNAALAELDQYAIEELFTQTFDLNPDCCAEIGWHLFGERYDRGSFMVWMRQQLRTFDLQETGELPDHLVHVLQVLGRMDETESERFATEAVTPALHRMIAAISKKENIFKHLLEATAALLEADFGPPKWKCNEGDWALRDDQAQANGSGE